MHTHKTMGWWQRCCLGLTLAAALPAAQAAALTPIEYTAPDQSVWTTRTNAQGEVDNPLFRVAGALFARAGIPWQGNTYPAARMFKYLQEGRAQFSMLVRAPSLQECCLFSSKPVAVAEIRAYRRAGAPAVHRVEDLFGQKVITIRGYSYGGMARLLSDAAHRVDKHEAPGHAAAFRMLASGRADYLLDYAGPAREIIADESLPAIESDLLSAQEVYLVLSRSYPDAESVMQRLERIVADPEVSRLLPR